MLHLSLLKLLNLCGQFSICLRDRLSLHNIPPNVQRITNSSNSLPRKLFASDVKSRACYLGRKRRCWDSRKTSNLGGRARSGCWHWEPGGQAGRGAGLCSPSCPQLPSAAFTNSSSFPLVSIACRRSQNWFSEGQGKSGLTGGASPAKHNMWVWYSSPEFDQFV